MAKTDNNVQVLSSHGKEPSARRMVAPEPHMRVEGRPPPEGLVLPQHVESVSEVTSHSLTCLFIFGTKCELGRFPCLSQITARTTTRIETEASEERLPRTRSLLTPASGSPRNGGRACPAPLSRRLSTGGRTPDSQHPNTHEKTRLSLEAESSADGRVSSAGPSPPAGIPTPS